MKIRSESQWLALFEKHETSGLSAAEFCRNEKLCAKHFSKRKQQLGWPSGQLSQTVKKQPVKDFIQVAVSEPQGNITVQYRELKLSLSDLPPASWLSDLLKALG